MQTQKLDFTGENIYVGFDVHLKSWTVTIMTDQITLKTFSQPPEPKLLHQYLLKHYPGATYHSAYEAGFCGYWIHNNLKLLGINSIVVNPSDIPTTDKEKVQKEDVRDSRKIARSLRNGDLKPIYVPSLKTLEDRTLVRTRSTFAKDLARNKNRVKSFLYFHGIAIPAVLANDHGCWSKRFVNWLENIEIKEPSGKFALNTYIETSKYLRESILKATRQISVLSKTDTYKKDVELLRSIPGIGLLTAMSLLTELETIDRFDNIDHFCSFIGLTPSTNSSGEKDIIGDLTRRGHSFLRSAIIESAWIAIRFDPALTKCYHDYCKRMVPNKAIVKIGKKLLNRIRYVLKNKQPYQYSIIR